MINIQKTLSASRVQLTSKSILSAFTSGSNHPNFLAHAYTCNRTQVPAQAASCNGWMLVKQVENGHIKTISNWVDAAHLYTPGK